MGEAPDRPYRSDVAPPVFGTVLTHRPRLERPRPGSDPGRGL